MIMTQINLGTYRGKNSRVFSGREEGKAARKKLNLDLLDKNQEEVEFVIPVDTLSFNTSFFLGLFGKSVRNLGENKFREIYQFQCKPIIKKSIDDGIIRALKSSNPLG
ncbi:hypothetical protein [Priestia sp. HNGD-A6]|uniref:hypothetical protein n=1 Tax=Priestia sp. HNGD-A6 TaxID=3092666 RepID=UPI0038912BDF